MPADQITAPAHQTKLLSLAAATQPGSANLGAAPRSDQTLDDLGLLKAARLSKGSVLLRYSAAKLQASSPVHNVI
jgi:hypothetical protein